MPAVVALTVDLGAVETVLNGEFGRVDIDGKASDIRFGGAACSVASEWQTTPGALPALRISGKAVTVVIC